MKNFILSYIIICLTNSICIAQNNLETRLRTEMPKALQMLDTKYQGKRYEIQIEFTELNEVTKKPNIIYRSHLKISRDFGVNEYHGDIRDQGRQIYNKLEGINADYAFSLEQNKNKTSWLLTDVCPANDLRANELVREPIKKNVSGNAKLASGVLVLGNVSDLIELIDRPDFAIKKIIETSSGIIVADFFYALPSNGSLGSGNVETTMSFDPEKHWLPVEWRQTIDNAKGKVNLYTTRQVEVSSDIFSVEYSTESKIVPRDKSAKDGTTSHTKTTGSFRATLRDIPESEFRMSFYGVPEPPEFQPKPTPLWVWLVAVFGVLALVAVGLRLVARRARS